MKLPRLFRTTAFRLTLLFLALFAAAAAAFLGYIYIATAGEVTRAADTEVSREIVSLVAKTTGQRRWIVGLPNFAAWLQGLVMNFVPGRPFSSDNYRSLKVDSVCTEDGFAKIKIAPHVNLRLDVHDYLTPFPKQVITPLTGKTPGCLQEFVPAAGLSFEF